MVALGAATAAEGIASGAQPRPPCRAEAELLPDRSVVGQQVLWRVRITTDADVTEISWISPPRFPDVRSERLPGRPDSVWVDPSGDELRTREEHLALFPERAGEIEIRSPGLRCSLIDGGAFDAAVAPGLLRVTSPPQLGRPADFSGLIGPLTAETHVGSGSMAVGESVRLVVSLRGRGNLWDAPDPFAGSASIDVEWFATRPVLKLQRGNRLGVQRLFEYDVVPHRPGSLIIPKLQIPYYDPAAHAYAVAEADEVLVTVAARPAAAASVPPPQPDSKPEANGDGGDWVGAAVLGLVVLTIAITAITRRRRTSRAAVARALEVARASRESGDRDAEAAALARALRKALARHLAPADLSPSELPASEGQEARVAAALQVLAAVERARFDPDSAAPRISEVERALRDL